MENQKEDLVDIMVDDERDGAPEVPEAIRNYVLGQEYFVDPSLDVNNALIKSLAELKDGLNIVGSMWLTHVEEEPDMFLPAGIKIAKKLRDMDKSLDIFEEHPVFKAMTALFDSGSVEMSEEAVDLFKYAIERISHASKNLAPKDSSDDVAVPPSDDVAVASSELN